MPKPVPAIAFVLATLLALVPVPAGEVHHLDETVGFPTSGLKALGFKAGPLTFEELVVRNMPDAGDIAEAESKDPDDSCHPKLQVGISNSGAVKMKVQLRVQLQGADGKVFMDCTRTDTVEPHASNDHTNLCWLDRMKTLDFPKVKKVRIVASVSPD